jgi:serine protease Do
MEEIKPFDYNQDEGNNETTTNETTTNETIANDNTEAVENTTANEVVENKYVTEETVVEESVAEEVAVEQKAQETPATPEKAFVPPYNPVSFSVVEPQKDTKPMSRGLKFFILVLVAIIALTTASTAGYFVGKNGKENFNIGADVNVGLQAKPQKNDELTAAEVYEKVNPSIVGICVYNSKGAASNATGVIYSEDGYIVTNDHIYSGVAAAKFKIYTHDNKEYDAEYVAGDNVSDLAVLKIKDGAKFKKATFGNSTQLIFGENVVAIGRPGGAENASSITKGIISATWRRVRSTTNYTSALIETDSPINPGSSGGALVNMYGQVIGITSSKLASADIDAVGYAIPTTTMKRIVEELIKNGRVISRAKLGITYLAIDSVSAEVGDYKYVGLYVDSVSEDSDLYGKVTKGDIITNINGIKVTSDDMVLDIIDKSKAGDKITVTFVNAKGKTSTVTAVLKANIGESSYTTTETTPLPNNDSSNSQGGAFDFPFGE